MSPKRILVGAFAILAIIFFGLKILQHQTAQLVAARAADIVTEASQKTLALKYDDVSGSGLIGASFTNLELRNLLTQKPLLRFSNLWVQVDLISYLGSDLKMRLAAAGPSGKLNASLEVDKRALEKGFILQKRSSYQAENLDLGPLLDALLAFHLQNTSRQRAESLPTKRSATGTKVPGPLQTVWLKNFEVTGSVKYNATKKSILEFGMVNLDLNVQKMVLGVLNQPSLDLSFAGAKLKMATKKQGAIKATSPLRFSASAAQILLEPQFEVKPGDPQLWSAFLKLDFQTKTTAARELLQRLKYEWQCSGSAERRASSTQKIFAAFQYNRLLCFERPK